MVVHSRQLQNFTPVLHPMILLSSYTIHITRYGRVKIQREREEEGGRGREREGEGGSPEGEGEEGAH